ncbi:MAG: hypothetical protein LBJ41_11185 [Treponema sp.]|jgi:hypothetical protein|nr:hypothetical protein [Treponema sp.]
MSSKDYVEHSYSGYDSQLNLVAEAVEENTKTGGTWTHIPDENKTTVKALYDDFHPRHVAAENPSRSKIDVEERIEARNRTEPLFRNFCQRFFYDVPDLVTDAQLERMNLRPRDKTRTIHGKPEWRVALEVEPSKTRTHTIRWHVAETKAKAMPEECNGWVLVYKVLGSDDPVPRDGEEMAHSQLVTRNPYVVEHKSEDEGKRIAYCGAFQSRSRGLMGDWGEVVVAVLS